MVKRRSREKSTGNFVDCKSLATILIPSTRWDVPLLHKCTSSDVIAFILNQETRSSSTSTYFIQSMVLWTVQDYRYSLYVVFDSPDDGTFT